MASDQLDIAGVFEDLVNQFSDPFAFYRELIQNSIDAGSGEVDIRIDFDVEDGEDEGLLVVHVDDFGEGMNREIIETRLTRLFSSGKDEDYTKIGKFGIGFVSVFAIDPEAVVVDTGRGGESWRVIFDQARDYQLIELDYPVEGTQVQIIKTISVEEHEGFVARSQRTVRRWCRYASIPIRFQGEDVREDFALENERFSVEFEEPGTRIVAGLVERRDAPYGYYNQGLLLRDGHGTPWPFTAFQIDSRYLEHTLTRDQVLEDDNFLKARKLLKKVVEEKLPEQLFDRLERDAAEDAATYRDHMRALYLLRRGRADGALPLDRPIVYRFGGGPVTLRQCIDAARSGDLYVTTRAGRLVEHLQDELLIVRALSDGPLARLLAGLCDAVSFLEEEFFLTQPVPRPDVPGSQAFLDVLAGLVRELGGRPNWVGFGDFDYPMSPIGDWTHVVVEDRRIPRPLDGEFDRVNEGEEIVLNVNHERVTRLIEVAAEEPEWAAYTFLKTAFLPGGLTRDIDEQLALAGARRRHERLRQSGGER